MDSAISLTILERSLEYPNTNFKTIFHTLGSCLIDCILWLAQTMSSSNLSLIHYTISSFFWFNVCCSHWSLESGLTSISLSRVAWMSTLFPLDHSLMWSTYSVLAFTLSLLCLRFSCMVSFATVQRLLHTWPKDFLSWCSWFALLRQTPLDDIFAWSVSPFTLRLA